MSNSESDKFPDSPGPTREEVEKEIAEFEELFKRDFRKDGSHFSHGYGNDELMYRVLKSCDKMSRAVLMVTVRSWDGAVTREELMEHLDRIRDVNSRLDDLINNCEEIAWMDYRVAERQR